MSIDISLLCEKYAVFYTQNRMKSSIKLVFHRYFVLILLGLEELKKLTLVKHVCVCFHEVNGNTG